MNLKEDTCFDELKWRAQCKPTIQEAANRSSLSYYLYVKFLSDAIDAKLRELPEEHRAPALQVAMEWGYETREQLEEGERWNAENGFCDHGIEMGCCPAGCGSGPDD